MAEETETEVTETVTTETETETVAPVATDDEPPAWFKKHLAEQAAKTTKTVAPKPTKTTPPPVKKTAPPKTTETVTEEPKPKKRSGASRAWFGSRADD